MKLLFLLIMSLNLSAQNYYCVQVISTRNPHLLNLEMVSILPDSAKIENSGEWYRILFVYPDLEQAEIAHTSWLKQHRNAFICVRSRAQVLKMQDLFTQN